MQLDELFRHYADPYTLAVALVKVYGTRTELLSQAAERWISTVSEVSTRPFPRQAITLSEEGDSAAWRLISALPGAGVGEFDPFRSLVAVARTEFESHDHPGTKGVRWEPVLIDALLSLAPTRNELSRWPEVLLGVVRHRSDEYVFHLAAHLSDEMPDLAYEMLDEALRRPEPAPQTRYFREPHAMMKAFGVNTPFNPYGWIALSRYEHVQSGAVSPRDLREIDAITPPQYLTDYFELVFGILHNGQATPLGVVDAARGALVSDDPRVRMRGIALLARLDESRDEAIDALVAWPDWAAERRRAETSAYWAVFAAPHRYDLADIVTTFGRGLFFGHGWGREKQRQHLHRIVGPMLREKGWSLAPWRSMLGPPLVSRKPRRSTDLDARVRDVVAEYLYRVAKDVTESLARRRAAITAIGRMQAATFAPDLGRFQRDAELKEVARQAQQRLRDANRESDLAIDVALEVSMRSFLEEAS
jgi:hypothetical protein